MNELIDCYVNSVAQYLPLKERKDVKEELAANIYDMLSPDASEEEIKNVLYGLGSPVSLSEKYQSRQRYIISPEFYPQYVQTLKWLLPVVVITTVIVGIVAGFFKAIENANSVQLINVISRLIGEGFTYGFHGASQTLIWTTIGYIIVERSKKKNVSNAEEAWKIEDLAKQQIAYKMRIPLSDSIIQLILVVLSSLIGFAICSGEQALVYTQIPFEGQVVNIFSTEFLNLCTPFIAGTLLFYVINYITRIVQKRWTYLVVCTTILSSVTSAGFGVYLLTRATVFNPKFVETLANTNWHNPQIAQFIFNGGLNNILTIIAGIWLVCALIVCAYAIYKAIQIKMNA